MPIVTIQSLVPDANVLIEGEQPEIARALMACLRSLNDQSLHLYNLTLQGEFTRGYPSQLHQAVNTAIAGAWSWLVGQGYLAPRPGSRDGDWMAITPQGKRWFESQGPAIQEPRTWNKQEADALLERFNRERAASTSKAEQPPDTGQVSTPEVGGRQSRGRVRINDLAKDLEVKSRHILEVLQQLGVGAGKTHSSSLTIEEAQRVRGHFLREMSPTERTRFGVPRPAGITPQIDLSRITKPGDVMKAILAKKKEYEAGEAEATGANPKNFGAFVRGTPGYTSEFCGVGGAGPVPDHLSVRSLANRLADLMILRETKLPLAIGLFGNWGSGKSHFMNLMDRRMKMPKETEPDPTVPRTQTAPPDQWCKQVVPIYFNAWHYSDSNLWASLVTQVFEALFDHLQPQGDELKLLQSKLQSAGGVTTLALEEVRDAQEGVRKASGELERARAESQSAKQAVNGFLNGLQTLIPELNTPQNRERVVELLGIEAEDATLTELDAKRKELASIQGRATQLWRRAFAREGRGARLAWLAGAVAAVMLCRLGISLLPQAQPLLARLGPLAQSLLVGLSAAIGWTAPAIKQVQSGLNQLEEWQKRAEDAQRAWRENPQVIEAENEVVRADARARAAEFALIEARSQESELNRALSDMRPERRLSKFIESRARSADYRGQLGLVSLARRDFEELSRIFAENGAPNGSGGETSEEAKALGQLSASVDRVVLFIDDLDRCEPEKVVDVLQAVHLLLAYPLFGVVVGVDQRCLKQSLRIRFKGLLTPDDGNDPRRADSNSIHEEIPATPLDYLEKIFHIPFHLPEMGQQGFANLVERLTEPVSSIESIETKSDKQGAAAGAAARPAGKRRPAATAAGPQGRVIGSVPLHRWERDALKDYHSLIRTPRGATRLLNTYRLVRAGVPSKEWDTFRGDEGGVGESRLAMLLLAVAAGKPAIAREWFNILRRRDDGDLPLPSEMPEMNRTAWKNLLGLYGETKTQVKVPLSQEIIAKWTERVELYTF
jgi:hypothetical protein